MLSLPPSVVASLPHPPSLTLDVFQFSFSASNLLLYLSNWTSFHLSLVVCVFKFSFFDLSAVKILPEAGTYVISSAGLLIWRKNKTKEQVLYRYIKMQKAPQTKPAEPVTGLMSVLLLTDEATAHSTAKHQRVFLHGGVKYSYYFSRMLPLGCFWTGSNTNGVRPLWCTELIN